MVKRIRFIRRTKAAVEWRERHLPVSVEQFETRPALPAGPVEVKIRALPQPSTSAENWWEFLQRTRAELQAAGSSLMTEEDVQWHIEDLRSGDERLDAVYRRIEDQ